MKLKPFQKQDLARLALHDGGILGWDKGLGKTLGMFLWCLLKTGRKTVSESAGKPVSESGSPLTHPPTHSLTLTPLQPCLLVGPGDVHDAIIDEGRDKLGLHVTPLDSQAAFLRLSTLNPLTGARELPPGFYLTSYTQLATNKVAGFPEFKDLSDETMMERLCLQWQHVIDFHDQRGTLYQDEYAWLEIGSSRRKEAHSERPPKADGQLESRHLDCYTLSLPQLEKQRDKLLRAAQRNSNLAREMEILSSFGLVEHFHGAEENMALDALPLANQLSIRKAMMVRKHAEYRAGLGEIRTVSESASEPVSEPVSGSPTHPPTHSPAPARRIKCLYDPSLADLCMDTFAAVAVDEGARIKGEDSHIGLGVRQMNPRYRLVLTGTPIKNRVPDIFRLAHWATGGHDEATARWPYACATSDRDAFAEEFLVSERNLTAEQKSETGRRYVKLTPQVCNIHRIWKLLAPIVLRKLKKDIGEELVAKHRHVIRVPMGSEQAKVYKHHLEGEYNDCNGREAMGARMTALRVVAAAPHSDLLKYAPQPKHAAPLPARSSNPWLPKYAAALTLMEQAMRRGEQFVLFSAIIEPLETLHRLLDEAGVAHLVAHGAQSPAKRRKISAQFKLGPPTHSPTHSPTHPPHFPILLAGGESMAEAHSWHLCNNGALLSYSWAHDKLSQCVDRLHRINSVKDLNFWFILCDGSMDRKMEQNLQEKGDTSDLVLDGHLLGENPQEVSLGELLRIAAHEFQTETKTVCETVIAAEWPELRRRLREAAAAWHPWTVSESVSKPVSESEIARPLADPPTHPPTNIIILHQPAPVRAAVHPWLARRRLQVPATTPCSR